MPIPLEDRAERPRGRSIRKYVLAITHGAETWPCHHCPLPVDCTLPGSAPNGPTLEHVIPISEGGTNDLENLRIAHRSCNLKRGDRPATQVGPQSRSWL